ncbi:MAG TPA: DUF3943 domain-containing protein [Vicinamibacteria bacterium]|nr:DUF3943 domain-containing protein [Vicinamibacteria bacterium]
MTASIRLSGAAIVMLASWAQSLGAQEPSKTESKTEERQPSWGLTTAIGTGSSGGDFGEVLRTPIAGDFNLFRNKGAWRFGFGVSFTSFKMEEPYKTEQEWGFQQTYLFATRMLRNEGSSIRPYIQLRGGLARLHPRSELFAFEPPPEEPGDSPTKASNGFSIGVIPGVEIRLNRSLALDLSGHINYFSVSEYDLSPIGLAPKSSGTTYEGRIGLRWHPDDGWPSGPAEPGSPDKQRDAWGVGKNLGWGIGEALAINWGASALNEYNRNANFNQISPRSWWDNLETGFTYDDNQFKTNQLIHPFNGSTYYNAGRANGFGFWESSLFALGGAFFWECCGETHPMSFNDMVSTGIGGVAYGEVAYRLSGEVLNNSATGKSRFFQELGAMFIDPIRGFNRALSGRWGREHENPSEPLDWRPLEKRSFLVAGARVIGEGDSITNNTKTYPYLALDHSFGSVFENERRKPFDSFNMVAQLSFSEKQPLTVWRLRGDIYSKPLGKSGNHAFAIVQHFDYYNNLAYEFGQQAFGPSLFSRFKLTDKLGLRLRLDGSFAILAAVNSDYSFVAEVANRERFREYDYGPGLGGGVEANLTRKGRPLLSFLYRFYWIDVSNGSIFNEGEEVDLPGGGTLTLEGSDATHYLHAPGFRLFVPLFGSMGIGADAFYFLRKSYYDLPLLRDTDQRNPEARVYVGFDIGGR